MPLWAYCLKKELCPQVLAFVSQSPIVIHKGQGGPANRKRRKMIKELTWVEEYNEKYPSIPMMQVEVGMVATYYIGSDSYADIVTNVVRFKSGARAGQINYIETTHEVNGVKTRFHAKERPCYSSTHERTESKPEQCVNCNQHQRGIYDYVSRSWSGQVQVGYAKEYRDPHF